MTEMAENTLDRYRQDAEQLVNDACSGLSLPFDEQVRRELIAGIQALVQRYIAHEMEWAVLVVEAVIRGIEERYRDVVKPIGVEMIRTQLLEAVASIRERGRA